MSWSFGKTTLPPPGVPVHHFFATFFNSDLGWSCGRHDGEKSRSGLLLKEKRFNDNVSTTTIANALAQHDNRHTETLQHCTRNEEKRRKRREWLHRNMGPVMYEIDAIMDVVAVIPIGKKNNRRGGNTGRGIVLPMGIE